MKKLILTRLTAAVICLGLLLVGCSGGTTPPESPAENEPSQAAQEPSAELKVLTTAVGAELNTLYPLNMDPQNNIGTKLCYEGLVNYVDGKVVPSLAESWEFANEGKDVVFHLKQNVTFHDGTPFNAEAVKIAFDYAKENPNFSGIAAAANLQSVDVADEYTVTFHYNSPYFAYLMDFCYPEVMVIVSPKVIEAGNFQNMKGVVGTGPYVYEELVDGSHVRFVRNENYWGEAPYYDEVIVKYIPEASARLQALKNGEVDMLYGSALLSWDDYQQALAIPNVKGEVAQSDSETRNLILNASGKGLSNRKVREAVAYAIDKQAIADGLTYGYESVANALFPSDIPYTNIALETTRSYDPAKASQLLDEAGWVKNESTGIREKDGAALSLKYTYDSGEAMNAMLAATIKSQLTEVGIEVVTEGQEMMTWWKEGTTGNYDITMWNTEQPYTSPHNFFVPMNGRSSHSPSLAGMEGSEEFLGLIAEFQTTDDSARVQEIFTRLLNYDNNNVLDLPLTYTKDMIVYNSNRIAGYEFSSTPMFFDVRDVQPVQ